VTRRHFCGSALLVLTGCVVASGLAVGCFAQVYNQNHHEIRVSDMPALTAKPANAADVLLTSGELIFHDREVCCGKNSALEDDIRAADPTSLKDVSDKLQGRHVVSDGRVFMVTAEYWPAAAGNSNSGDPISEIMEKRPLLMEWNSHLYVVYGVIYDTVYYKGGSANEISKFLLLDTRFSDERRKVFFNRQTDDWGKVQGLLMLKAEAQ
jgi:hypothetical protein